MFGLNVIKKEAKSLYDYYPSDYFNDNLSPLIRVKYDSSALADNTITFTECSFLKNKHY